MRFNNRVCALMDIPDLPQGAFEHIGDKKIKPQGGGNPISAITDPISDVLGTSGGGGGILGAVEDVGQSIGSGLAEVDKFVGREIPGGWVTPALIAAAVAAPYAAPYLAGEGVAAAGAAEAAAALEAAALAEGATTAGMVGAANTGLAAGTATLGGITAAAEAATLTGAFDAANLAAQGLSEGAIAQNLTASGIDSFVAQDMARLAATGMSEEAIAQAIAYSYTPAELAGTGLTSMANTLPAKGLTAAQAIQGARMASGLLGQQQQPQPQPQQQMMIGGRQTNPYGGVDYSGLLNLLSPNMAQRNQNSLLG
jgi:hypothetical protein